ncbi:MAG: alpha,alpha-trehalase [Clostridia bacterium]|nr:alpha,alpha-trehalase [Clostridia bacterium]
MKLSEYIKSHWDDTVRLEREGNERLVGLPYPYFVPSIKGAFQEMYYWDTFFAAKGIYLCGKEAMVKNNADNMLYMIEKFGYMPNGSHRGLFGRSQPPLLSETVKDLYGIYKDPVWLSAAYNVLKKEYKFWTSGRNTETGLNRYGFDATEENIPSFANMIKGRLKGLDFSGMSDREIVENEMSDAESGWDFNPRCELCQTEFNHVDLNGILYGFECNMAYFSIELANGEENLWKERADRRKALIHELLFDGETFRDYNFKKKEHSPIFSAASFYILWAGAATDEEAASTVKKLPLLEREHGVAVCEEGERNTVYQWDFPNGWAPMHYIVVYGLLRYGYREDALRIAKKYVTAIEGIFEKTGTLWEKYNVVEGSTNVKDEYEMPEMLGWTAGIYLDFKNLLGE